jgi:hypothetical protein
MTSIKEDFEITAPVSTIEFVNKRPITKFKINKFSYQTASVGGYRIYVIISGLENKNVFTDRNGKRINYTTALIVPETASTPIVYSSFPNTWDVELDFPLTIGQHTLQLYINGSSSNIDISTTNPIFIEFEFI